MNKAETMWPYGVWMSKALLAGIDQAGPVILREGREPVDTIPRRQTESREGGARSGNSGPDVDL